MLGFYFFNIFAQFFLLHCNTNLIIPLRRRSIISASASTQLTFDVCVRQHESRSQSPKIWTNKSVTWFVQRSQRFCLTNALEKLPSQVEMGLSYSPRDCKNMISYILIRTLTLTIYICHSIHTGIHVFIEVLNREASYNPKAHFYIFVQNSGNRFRFNLF